MVQVEDVCRIHPSPHRLLQPEGSEPQQQEQRHSQRHLLHRTQQTLRLLSQPGLGEEPGRDLCGAGTTRTLLDSALSKLLNC